MSKQRIDVLLVSRGYFESREKARRAIMAGEVLIDEQVVDKAGTAVDESGVIRVKSDPNPYVSRGGLKLEKAIKSFSLDLNDKVCMDVGASTGGFTDCMLKNGAKKVYSVDVGYGQLAWTLRQDERVVSMERTNIRHVTEDMIGENPDFASIDVSFISLKLVLPVVYKLLKEHGQVVALIKPQFEAGRDKIGKKGVVRDQAVHEEVIEKICTLARENAYYINGLDFSPIKGPEGNIEYLIFLSKNELDISYEPNNGEIKDLVNRSHSESV